LQRCVAVFYRDSKVLRAERFRHNLFRFIV
jgi:hypothetical protein